MVIRENTPVLVSEMSDIEETRNEKYKRDVSYDAAFRWLSHGWRDLWTQPIPSLIYGVTVFVASLIFLVYMYDTGRDYFLFPALAGFMIVGAACRGRALSEEPQYRKRAACHPSLNDVGPAARRRAGVLHRNGPHDAHAPLDEGGGPGLRALLRRSTLPGS